MELALSTMPTEQSGRRLKHLEDALACGTNTKTNAKLMLGMGEGVLQLDALLTDTVYRNVRNKPLMSDCPHDRWRACLPHAPTHSYKLEVKLKPDTNIPSLRGRVVNPRAKRNKGEECLRHFRTPQTLQVFKQLLTKPRLGYNRHRHRKKCLHHSRCGRCSATQSQKTRVCPATFAPVETSENGGKRPADRTKVLCPQCVNV